MSAIRAAKSKGESHRKARKKTEEMAAARRATKVAPGAAKSKGDSLSCERVKREHRRECIHACMGCVIAQTCV